MDLSHDLRRPAASARLQATLLGVLAVLLCSARGGPAGGTCSDSVRSAVALAEHAPLNARGTHVLRGFADPACEEALGPVLHRAALQGGVLTGAQRSAALGKAGADAGGAACVASNWAERGGALLQSCPMPASWGLDARLLRDLDAGTYAWVRAVWQRLEAARTLTAPLHRGLQTLLLSAAVAAETQGRKP